MPVAMRHRPDRLKHIAGIGVDRMGSIADASGADFLRLENLDVDIPPDEAAVLRTQRAPVTDADNSYLPFVGQRRLRDLTAQHVSQVSGVAYSGERNCVISAGGLSGILNVLLATVDVGDEVIVTDPTYAGLINRIRLAGAVPTFASFQFTSGGRWKLNRDAMRRQVSEKTRAMLLMSPSMPSGACFDAEDWDVIAALCVAGDLLRVSDFGIDGETMSRRLLDQGVCATAMTGWGTTHGEQYIRFVFANEPVARLELLGARVRQALSI